ncbi:MAG TPA: hypothetical protein VHU22_17785 [Xanthobacteraceae bacterium]|nr:hypothetical protein [Xanthobacteraceae bacterium]
MAKSKQPKSATKKPGPSVIAPPIADPGTAETPKSGKTKRASPTARVFPVDTRFQQLARRAGGVPRDKAIERAQMAMEDVKPAYEEFLGREVTGLAELVKNVEAGHDEPGWLETATFRARQLRDSAGPLGYELITFVAASLCELLDSIEAGSECNMESIVCHVDALMLARQKSYRGLRPEQVPELTKGLQRVVKHVTI